MWKKLASSDTGVNLSILNYLTREFRSAAKHGMLRGDIRIYASSEGFLFNDGAVAQFAILRGNAIAGMSETETPSAETLGGYTLVLSSRTD